jgi:hypothetical protein
MKHVIKHRLGQEAARKTVLAAWNEYQSRFSKYKPLLNWQSENRATVGFDAKGFSFRGNFAINPASIDVDLEVPLIMRPFKGIALAAVEREIERWVAKANAGQI